MDAHAPYQNGVVVPYPIAYEPEILGGWFFNPGQNSMCIDHWDRYCIRTVQNLTPAESETIVYST
jgi:hypothetical protein